jgi:pimeloyl-ACP methyl ester carboxylesterase
MTEVVDVILVHGTWGRGFFPRDRAFKVRWFEEGSGFYRSLANSLAQAGFRPRMRALCWSGSNSISSRSQCADRLRDDLQIALQSDENIQQLVIGHSHGGSIVMLAAHRLRKASVSLERLHIATMATPFVEVSISKKIIHEADDLIPNPVVTVPLTAMVVCWVLLLPIGPSTADVLWSMTFGVATLLISIPLMRLGLAHSRKIRRGKKVPKRLLRYQEATEGGASWVGSSPLVLRAIDDEAALSLAAGAITNRLSDVVFIKALRAFFWVGGLGFSLIFFYNKLSIDGFGKTYGLWYLVAPIGVFGLCAVSVMSLQLSRTVFGREFLFPPFGAEINSQSAPDMSGPACIITVQAAPGIRHSIYDIEEVPKLISQWFVGAIADVRVFQR